MIKRGVNYEIHRIHESQFYEALLMKHSLTTEVLRARSWSHERTNARTHEQTFYSGSAGQPLFLEFSRRGAELAEARGDRGSGLKAQTTASVIPLSFANFLALRETSSHWLGCRPRGTGVSPVSPASSETAYGRDARATVCPLPTLFYTARFQLELTLVGPQGLGDHYSIACPL